MSTMRSQDEIRNTVVSLGLPEHPYFMRRTARAMDLLDTGKVNFVSDEIFRVHSQFDDTIYHVELNHGTPGCTCADHQKNPGVLCKHMIAATVYSKQAKSTVKVTWDDTENSYHKRGRWWVTDYKRKVKYIVYRDGDGKLICPCDRKPDCEHRKAIREYLNNNDDGNGSKITHECGSNEAKALQDKMNGQLNKSGNNGNGAQAPSQDNIDPSAKIFVECDKLDEQQILAGEGDKVHKLSDNSYCISYMGINALSEKYGIVTETLEDTPEEGYVTVKAYRSDTKNGRLSTQPVNGSFEVAEGKARRNACRMLIPVIDIRVEEHKAMWRQAQAACLELVPEHNLNIIIEDLQREGMIEQNNPSHLSRQDWVIVYDTVKKDTSENPYNNNDGGEISPSSNDDEVNRYKVLADAEVNPNFQQRYDECKKLVGMSETDLIISQELNFRYRYYKDKITDAQWDVVLQECQWRWNARQAKAEFASAQQAYKFKHIRDVSGYDVRSKKYVGRPPLNSQEFITKCQEAIAQVRAEKNTVEANDMPLESGNVKRQLQMDKKLRTWLIESDGTKQKISCREICEQFNDGSLVTRLRACIDDGADISTVELDD